MQQAGIIHSMQHSGTVLENTYREIFASAKPGMRTDEIDAIIRKAAELAGRIFKYKRDVNR